MNKLKKKIKEKKRDSHAFIKKSLDNGTVGIIHIKSCRNNMIFTLTDLRGNTLSTISGGSFGYKNAQKKTWLTIRECAYRIGKKAREHGYKCIYINLRGDCIKRMSAFRGLKSARCLIINIYYRSFLPHNGCRIFKKRRK